MTKNVVNYFKFGPVVQEEVPFKDISYLELWQPLWWSGSSCAILVEGIIRNKSMKLF